MHIFAQIDNCNRADFTLYRKKNKNRLQNVLYKYKLQPGALFFNINKSSLALRPRLATGLPIFVFQYKHSPIYNYIIANAELNVKRN